MKPLLFISLIFICLGHVSLQQKHIQEEIENNFEEQLRKLHTQVDQIFQYLKMVKL